MATSTDTSFVSLLCKEPWDYYASGECLIKFEGNGTGHLICRSELVVFISVELEWKLLSLNHSAQRTTDNKNTTAAYLLNTLLNNWWFRSTASSSIAEAEIEVTLLKQHARILGPMKGCICNEHVLKPEAFLPKRFAITLEKGSFWPAGVQSLSRVPDWISRHSYRLLFDKSPFPPRDEWKDPDGGPDANQFWEFRKFCSHPVPKR
ncbi:hypothetical protein K469DRAFT_650591 [Zopfia rhizophila CBS 207.26]|uniref:Uncharacterized protein n=1 Tax=Zopfia rhizophila CBS 207.26 TaxID=1314779 RepID=A0A6A6EXK8_9PEZI|nr:hypothetical protein K469DRAFT_650591 [Zopfia rhizophila CBS 207.26]